MSIADNDIPAHVKHVPVELSSLRRSWNGIKQIAIILLIVVVGVVAALSIVLAVATHASSNGRYTVLGHPVMTVLSGSMTPTIRTGDLIVDRTLTATQASHLHAGQIITFRVGSGKTFTHRIASVTTSPKGVVVYRTKGDANNAPDANLRPASSVIGLYQERIPDGGYILNFFHRPFVPVLLLLSLLLGLAAGPLFRRARKFGEEERSARTSGASTFAMLPARAIHGDGPLINQSTNCTYEAHRAKEVAI